MSKSTSADSGEPEDHGRGDAASDGAEDSGRPQADDAAPGDATEDGADGDAAAEDVTAEDESTAADRPKNSEKSEPADKPTEVAAGKSADRPRSGSVRTARSARAGASSSGRPTSVRAAEAGKGKATASRAEAEARRTTRPNVFARIARYVREVIAELRKVVTPTRNELFTYITVVVVFLIIMMAYVSGLDFGIGRLVLWAFGG